MPIKGKSQEIWDEIVRLLTAAMVSGQPLDFVNRVYQGKQEDVPDTQLPVIILDPADDKETKIGVPHQIEIIDAVNIICWTRDIGIDTRVTGSALMGIKEFARLVKNTINTEPNLINPNDPAQKPAGNTIELSFPSTVYALNEQGWPYNAANIRLEIKYRAQDTMR